MNIEHINYSLFFFFFSKQMDINIISDVVGLT